MIMMSIHKNSFEMLSSCSCTDHVQVNLNINKKWIKIIRAARLTLYLVCLVSSTLANQSVEDNVYQVGEADFIHWEVGKINQLQWCQMCAFYSSRRPYGIQYVKCASCWHMRILMCMPVEFFYLSAIVCHSLRVVDKFVVHVCWTWIHAQNPTAIQGPFFFPRQAKFSENLITHFPLQHL